MNSLRIDDMNFPAVGEDDWRKLAEAALKGGSFASLVSRAEDGFAYGPIHTRRRDAAPILRAAQAGAWTIVQRIDDPDPARANAQALADLEGGADGLALVFEGAPSAAGFGLPMRREVIARALEGVMLAMIRLRIEPGGEAGLAVDALRRLAEEQGAEFNSLDLELGLGDIGAFALSGIVPEDEAALRREAGRQAKSLIDDGFRGRVATADGRLFHEAGATDGQELGTALGTALHHLRAMTDAGIDAAAAASAIGFSLAVDQKQLLQTAKLRALRLLWQRVLEECGVEAPRPACIHAETSRRMMAAKDPHTNILRATIAAFSAAVGGADSISVLPYTSANGLPEAQARRLARNTQLILLEEAGLARVGDPCAGSGGIEALSDALAEAGWDEFRRIEAEGGLLRSLGAGALQARITEAGAARRKRVADKSEPVIGVTLYPMQEERDIAVAMPRSNPEDGGMPSAEASPPPLRPHRLAEEVENAA